MENQLDGVEEGKIQWTAMLKEFYEKFSRWLADAKNAGAPDAEKAQAVLKLLQEVRNWEAPEKGSKRVYDDKKFYTSVQNKAEKGAGTLAYPAPLGSVILPPEASISVALSPT